MMSEAATLVLLVGDRMVRADFAPGAEEPASVLSAPRAPGGSLADTVREALALNGKPRRRVWVMADELWTQSVVLSGNQVRGLSDAQIDRALSFEIEPFSGIPTTESVLGFRQARELNGAHSFWIVEMTKADRDAVQCAVRELGGRLEGIAHPGGLPHSLTNNGRVWQRLEYWESGTIWLANEGDAGVKTQVVNALPPRAALPTAGTFELLGTGAPPTVPEAGTGLPWQRYSLRDDESLRRWLRHWRLTFSGKAALVPTVVPAPTPPSTAKYVVGCAAMLIGATLLCVAHATYATWSRVSLSKELAAHTAVTKELEGLSRQTAALQQQLAAFQTAEGQRTAIVARRASLAALLRAAASARPEDLVLRDIQVESPSSMIINGRALESSSVDELSLALTEQLKSAGWVAQPLQKIALRRLANSGPWQFSLRLLHAEALREPAAKSPASKGVRR